MNDTEKINDTENEYFNKILGMIENMSDKELEKNIINAINIPQ